MNFGLSWSVGGTTKTMNIQAFTMAEMAQVVAEILADPDIIVITVLKAA